MLLKIYVVCIIYYIIEVLLSNQLYILDNEMREGNNERCFLKMAAEVRSYEKIEEENSQRSVSNTSQQYERSTLDLHLR